MVREARDAARGGVGFHDALRDGFAESRGGFAQRGFGVFNFFLSDGRLDFLDQALNGA